MELWLGKDFLLPFGAVVLLCLYFYILKAGDINSLYYNASGMWWHGKIPGEVLPYKTVILAEDIAPKSNEGCS